MRKLTLSVDMLTVDSFATDPVGPAIGPMKTYEPGCTLPELGCGGTVML